jgi:DNA-binding MarR family transcriptional regulator
MVQSDNEFQTRYQTILPPNALAYRLKLLSQLIERRFQDLLDPLELTPLHWGILCCLWQEDGLPTLQISKQLQQLSGNISVALPLMEKQGYIQRQPDERDRRILRVWLTPKGKDLKEILPQQAQELDRDLFAALSADERVVFSALINRLRSVLETESD